MIRFLIAVTIILILAGCSKDVRVTQAEEHAKKRVENFVKNTGIRSDALRESWRKEARGHTDTKHDWSLDKLNTRATIQQMKPLDIITESKAISDKRRDIYLQIDGIVDAEKEVEQTALRDIDTWRVMNSKIDEYYRASQFNFFGLFGKGSKVDPPAVVDPVVINSQQTPVKAEVLPVLRE